MAEETYQDHEKCKPTSAWAQGLRYSPRAGVQRLAYVSGPMRGRPEFNFPAFDAARDALLAAGWNVISPADIDRACPVEALDPQGAEQSAKAIEAYVARDLEAIKLLNPGVDAVVVLPGWETSRGATAEASVAAWRSVRVLDLETAVGPMAAPLTIDDVAQAQAVENAQAAAKAFGETVERLAWEGPPPPIGVLPTNAAARKAIPLVSGLLDYFPAALAEVAHVSQVGNEQHNPGEPLHWARHKSTDQADCIVRHLLERGGFDTDGMRHSAKLVWRALALLQLELEAEGAPVARGAR